MKKTVLSIAALIILGFCWRPQLVCAADEEYGSSPMQIRSYKPMYALLGVPFTKIQVSFKASLINSVPLFFGYSQLMLWDIFVPSPKMNDVNYNPELFYRFMLDPDRGRWIDAGLWEHESNGRGDAEEKSWDRLYVRWRDRLPIGSRAKLAYEIKAWLPVHCNPHNENLAQYRGLWELHFTLSDFLGSDWEHGDLSLRLYPGGPSQTNPLAGGQELMFRSRLPEGTVQPVIVAQIFHGFGEYMDRYSEEIWGFRAGFGF